MAEGKKEEQRIRIEIDDGNAKNIRRLQEIFRSTKLQLDSIIATLVNVHGIPKTERWELTPDCSAFIKISSSELVKPKGLKDKEVTDDGEETTD